ncbi:MAG TPA: 2-oxoacid:acceptor oxidoreductase subunit alpha [Saprospiraceae bacterium]|nr:2-oxoacid:acceptor oxidoreductase subunit alpha [Saprospiraceae bacterium]
MSVTPIINDLVIRFANVNGTGSASANGLFAKSLFRMGLPISPKNIFPSNIQGLPTWYEVRVSEKGYLGRREGIDIVVGVNPQSLEDDIASVRQGGYFIYDSSKKLHSQYLREDIHFIGIPMISLSMQYFQDPRHQQLFKNIIYVGALAALINMDMQVIHAVIRDQFKSKPKLVEPNVLALQLGFDYARQNYECPLPVKVQSIDINGDKILIEGNTAAALGLLYGGATVAAWYPITPSTSLAQAFELYAHKYRKDPDTGKNRFAVVQAEDELAAIGMVIGATWNGARAFTATSGPGISLMSEFIGLAYFAEIPAALINVQRGGPSTGMPTRTQQSDLLACAYASHGDTKHPLLLPANPSECFTMGAQCLDLADRLQTVVFLMLDLDLGMNDHMTEALQWNDNKQYDKGKVLSAENLESIGKFGRYLDTDGDGITYRTIPGVHPTKGSYFTRGTSRDEYARYTEKGDAYVRNMDRLKKKWETIKKWMPKPELYQKSYQSKLGMIFFGTTTYAALETMDRMKENNIIIDSLRLKAFPFGSEVEDFIHHHEFIYIVEQNRDAQMKAMIVNELGADSNKFISILNYDGMPITADFIYKSIAMHLKRKLVVA